MSLTLWRLRMTSALIHITQNFLKREKVSPSSSWTGKNTSEILYFRQNNQAMLSCHYLFVYWGKKENKNNHIKNQGYPNWKFGASIYNLQGFAAIWHLTFWLHGDFEPENLGSEEYKPCVYEIHDFTSTFLFSVETQHTIGEVGRLVTLVCISGYGSRGSTNECWDTVLLQCIQSIVGVIIQVLTIQDFGKTFQRIDARRQKHWTKGKMEARVARKFSFPSTFPKIEDSLSSQFSI